MPEERFRSVLTFSPAPVKENKERKERKIERKSHIAIILTFTFYRTTLRLSHEGFLVVSNSVLLT